MKTKYDVARISERGVWPAGLALLIALAGCGDSPARAGFVTATIRESSDAGVNQTAYRGTGDFLVTRDPGAGADVSFELTSHGVGANTDEMFMLYRPGEDRPGPGRYDLALLTNNQGQLRGFTAFYHRKANARSESFVAASGYVDIQKSTDEGVEGEFDIMAVLYCVATQPPAEDDWCVSPADATMNSKQIDISGSFTAVFEQQAVVNVELPTSP